MTIGYYIWSQTDEVTKNRLLQRGEADISAIIETVKPMIERVRREGDKALIAYAKQFDRADLNSLKVTEEEFEEARKMLDPSVRQAIDHCAGNVRKFHQAQMARLEKDRYWLMEIEEGVYAGEKITPIDSVGLYVPGGKNQYPSAVYMLGIPARLAGVEKIVMATPARPDGKIGDALLYAAEISGISEIYKVGGAQAVAALAYGTQTIPKVSKILGPGSPYVAAAKQLLGGIIDPGMPAGPSESLVLCDESAHPLNTVWDILNEAEHGPDSASLLVTPCKALADQVAAILPELIQTLPEPQRGWLETNMAAYSGIILTNTMEEAVDFCNLYATEHLLLRVKNPDQILPYIHHAGEILIGEHTLSSFGNYGIGVNHVLPTGAKAKSYSCTSVWDFLKRTSLAKVTNEGFKRLKNPIKTLTDYEGFPAHKSVISERILKS